MMRGRWFIVVIAALLWFVILGAWIGEDPELSATAYDALSSYNTSAGGVSQAFGYLALRYGGVRRIVRNMALEQPPRNATILRIGAVRLPAFMELEKESKRGSKKEKQKKEEEKKKLAKRAEKLLDDSEEAWVRAGGRLVIAPSGEYLQIQLDPGTCSDYRQVFPTDPPLPRIDVPNCHSMSGAGLQRFHSLLINDSGPVLARWPLGAGEVIVFSLPEALSNEYVGRSNNLVLLDWLAGSGRPVYFDETIHGIEMESSVWDLLVTGWGLGPAMVILAAAALAAFWRKARATGPPERAEREIRSEAVDLVQSLGQLYDRAVDREESLRLYYQALVRTVHARTGLTGEALDRLVRRRTEGYDPRPRFKDITREDFQRMLKILNHAYETVGYANTR